MTMRKQTVTILLVFAMLGALATLTLNRKAERGIVRLDLSSVDTHKLERVEMRGPHGAVLTKKNGVWQLPSGRKADPDGVKQMLDSIKQGVSSDFVTDNTGRFVELGVEGAEATQVVLFADGRIVRDFYVGHGQPGVTHVRERDQVFKVTQMMPYIFNRDDKAWEDHHMHNDVVADIAAIHVMPKDSAAYTVVQSTDGLWDLQDKDTFAKPFRFDPMHAQSLGNALMTTQAASIVEPNPGSETTGLTKEQKLGKITWVFTDDAAKKYGISSRTLYFGKEKPPQDDQPQADLYASVDGKDLLFTVQKYQVDSLLKPVTEFRALDMMVEANADDVVGVRINNGKELISFARNKDAWQIAPATRKPKDFVLDENKVKARIRQVFLARAMGVADAKQAKKAVFTGEGVMLTMRDKKQFSLSFGNETKKKEAPALFARGTRDTALYLASKALRNNLTEGLESFRKAGTGKGAGFAEEDSLAGLSPEVRSQVMRQVKQAQKAKNKN